MEEKMLHFISARLARGRVLRKLPWRKKTQIGFGLNPWCGVSERGVHDGISIDAVSNSGHHGCHSYDSASAVRVRERAMMKELHVAMVPDPSSHCNTSVEDESSEEGLTHGTTPESTAKSISMWPRLRKPW